MGLYEEAIEEFLISMKSPELKVVSMVMIGICYINKSEPDNAIKILSEAYQEADDEQKIDIEYQLGVAHEMKNETEEALKWFEMVYSRDASFKDVAEKVEMLRSLKKEAKAEQEYERLSLEDILGDEYDETESQLLEKKTPQPAPSPSPQKEEKPQPEPEAEPKPVTKKAPSKKKITFV